MSCAGGYHHDNNSFGERLREILVVFSSSCWYHFYDFGCFVPICQLYFDGDGHLNGLLLQVGNNYNCCIKRKQLVGARYMTTILSAINSHP